MLRGRLFKSVAAALAVCFVYAEAAAQTGAPAARAEMRNADEADVAITARVTAKELIFRKVPNPRVEFTGRPERETVWEAERHNLPAEVRPGVTYRDIGITLRITSIFPDIERIVAEALGEIPAADVPPPDTSPAPRTPNRPRRGRRP